MSLPQGPPEAQRSTAIAWWIGSAAVHVLALLALILSPDLRKFIFGDPNAPPPPLHTSPKQIDLAKQVLVRLTKERIIKANVDMDDVAKKLRKMRGEVWKELERRATYNTALAKERDNGLAEPLVVAAPGSIEQDDVPTLYALARRLEVQAIEIYEQHRAISMTVASSGSPKSRSTASAQSIADSLALAQVERPPRPDMDLSVLTRTILNLTDGNWAAFKKEMDQASDTVQIMANNVRRILTVVEGRDGDITGRSLVGDAAAGVELERWKEKNVYVGATLDLADRLPSDLESVDPKAKIIRGRHIASDGQAEHEAEWIAIDTWWTIGPFAYEGGARTKASLTHAYPPEAGVDLDSVYTGKGGKPLRWTWRTFEQVRMEPSVSAYAVNAIWYWYAEFTSDREREVWANVASDDYGTLWCNGEQVYSSGMEPHPWVPLDQRQFVKLKVKKGVNKLLMKLDNGKGTTGFTVVLALGKFGEGN